MQSLCLFAIFRILSDGTGMCMSDSADLFCADLQSTVDNLCDLSCDWWGGSGILQFIFPGKIFEKYIPEDAENADGEVQNEKLEW